MRGERCCVRQWLVHVPFIIATGVRPLHCSDSPVMGREGGGGG